MTWQFNGSLKSVDQQYRDLAGTLSALEEEIIQDQLSFIRDFCKKNSVSHKQPVIQASGHAGMDNAFAIINIQFRPT